MKKILMLVYVLFHCIPFFGQTIEIHQIDVGAGDATLIKVNTRVPAYAILLDAGTKSNGSEVIGYLSDAGSGNLGANPYLDLVITSHFHDDHMGGLVGKSNTGDVTDCASFTGVLGTSSGIRFCGVMDKGDVAPLPTSDVYANYCTLAAKDSRRVAVGALTAAGTTQYNLPAPATPAPRPTFGDSSLRLGGTINLGADSKGTPVKLRLIAANGYVYSPNSPGGYVDVAATAGVSRSNPGSYLNANNWGVGFILEYGQFRYFTGGDFGGYKVGAYLDLETPIATALPAILTTAGTEGHVCAFKLNHHGSRESTNDSLLKTMKPTFAAISCGNRHDHPNQEALDRLQETTWTKTANYFNQGLQRYVLTELRLQRFIIEKIGMTSGNIGYVVPLSLAPPKTIVKKKTSMPSRTKNKRKIIRSALYELKSQSTVAGDFIIKVFEENNSKQSIADVSAFSLVVSNYANVQSIDAGTFNCHKK